MVTCHHNFSKRPCTTTMLPKRDTGKKQTAYQVPPQFPHQISLFTLYNISTTVSNHNIKAEFVYINSSREEIKNKMKNRIKIICKMITNNKA